MSELEEKIKRELSKSGFPLQVFCQRCLLANGWAMSGSTHMIFGDESKKEIDVEGYFQEDLTGNTSIIYIIHVACKKSHDNPWVFFKELPWGHLLIQYENIKMKNPSEVTYKIKDLHFHHVPVSSIYTMAFKGKGKTNQIYEAIMNLISSYEFLLDFRKKHEELRQRKSKGITVAFPTILLDGKLFLATVEHDDSIKLQQKSHIICCHCEAKYPRFRYYNIEVVTKDYFNDYLNILNRDRELISGFYRKEISPKGV